MPCPEVVAVSYIRQAEVPTLFSVERDTQVEQKNHKHGFLTVTEAFTSHMALLAAPETMTFLFKLHTFLICELCK